MGESAPRLVLVGESPGRDPIPLGKEHLSLLGDSGKLLCGLAGWDWQTYIERTTRRNLFYIPVPQKMWSAPVARAAAAWLIGEFAGKGLPVLVLGEKVKAAFEANMHGALIPTFGWTEFGDEVDVKESYADGKPRHFDFRTQFGHIPHPSGRNRVWNDPAKRALAREFLEHLID